MFKTIVVTNPAVGHSLGLRALLLAGLVMLVFWTGCGIPDEEPVTILISREDTLAYRAIEADGGMRAWQNLRHAAFSFGTERDGVSQPFRRHIWDRHTGDYRLEYPVGSDTATVVLFNVHTQAGAVYKAGTLVGGADAEIQLSRAYRAFINDTYWFLFPVKLLDPGVTRTLLPDTHATAYGIELTYDGVGLTPGDRFRAFIDRETYKVTEWSFILEGNPTAPATHYRWEEEQTFMTAGGPLSVRTRKVNPTSGRVLLTDDVRLEDQMDQRWYTDGSPSATW